jgi:hypothetical protein
MGEMKRAIAREEQERRSQDRFASTIVIAAAVRLARDDISSPLPRITRPLLTASAWHERSCKE